MRYKCTNISQDLDKFNLQKISDADWAAPLTYKNNIYEKNYLLICRSENQTGLFEIIQGNPVAVIYFSCKDLFG